MLHYMCWSLSPVFVKIRRKKRGMGYQEKNIWTHESPSTENKERKKCGHMKVHEKKDSDALKRIYIGREIIQKEFPFHPSQSIHVHILI
jgi:hypothetical protein